MVKGLCSEVTYMLPAARYNVDCTKKSIYFCFAIYIASLFLKQVIHCTTEQPFGTKTFKPIMEVEKDYPAAFVLPRSGAGILAGNVNEKLSTGKGNKQDYLLSFNRHCVFSDKRQQEAIFLISRLCREKQNLKHKKQNCTNRMQRGGTQGWQMLFFLQSLEAGCLFCHYFQPRILQATVSAGYFLLLLPGSPW